MESDKITQRTGNFSSSEIYRLAACGRSKDSIGTPFYTYVEEKKREIRAGRQISNEASANSTEWGHMCEPLAHELLPLDHKLIANEGRIYHPTLPWTGVPDGLEGDDIVTDIKSPYTLTKYYDRVDALLDADIVSYLKKKCKENFWQLVSNAILTGRSKARLYVFMPNKSMLESIKLISQQSEGKYWFHTKSDDELPWIADNKKHKIVECIPFDVSEDDKQFLTERVALAANLLNK